MGPCACDADTEAEAITCCEALPAWRQGQVERARDQAARAIDVDPLLSPAWFLYAHTSKSAGNRAEWLQLMETLAADAIVGSRARSVLRRHAHRWDRDQVHLSLGLTASTDGFGPLLAVDVPLHPTWGLRFDTWSAHSTHGYGPAATVSGTWSAVAGSWRVGAVVGAKGLSQHAFQSHVLPLDDSASMVPGATASVRVDVRVRQAWGLGLECGVGAWLVSDIVYVHPTVRLSTLFFAPARRTW